MEYVTIIGIRFFSRLLVSNVSLRDPVLLLPEIVLTDEVFSEDDLVEALTELPLSFLSDDLETKLLLVLNL